MTFKIALIGCGWAANAGHGPAMTEYAASHPEVVLSACCDLDPARAEACRARFGFQHAYSDYLELLRQEGPQAVCLAVPPSLLCEMGCEIMRRGYPLLSEKPPGLSVAEVDRLIAAADASGVIHQVAFNRRFMPLVAELKQRLSGQVIQHIDALMVRIGRLDPVFATTAVHVIDLARYLVGRDYQDVRPSFQELPHLGAGVANFTLDCRFAGEPNVTAHLGFYPVAGVNIERAMIQMLDQTFFLEANAFRSTPNGPDTPGRLCHFRRGQLILDIDAVQLTGRREDYYLTGFYHQDAAFFAAVQAGQPCEHDFRAARQSIQIMQRLIDRR